MQRHPIDANAFLLEQLEALLQEFDQVGDNAPQGQILNNLDAFLFVKGRAFLTEFLETKMQERINNAEKPAEVKQCPHCKKKTKNIGKRQKTVTTANNHIRLARTYRQCGDCKTYAYPADQLIGSGSDYTDSAKRLIAFAAGNSSYRGGAAALQEFCGIPLSHNTVSAVAVEVADEECLDIFHAAEHISDCGKILYKNAEEHKKWFEEMRMVLLKEDYMGVGCRLRILQRDKSFSKKQRKKVFQVRKYFWRHRSRLQYRERLAAGRSIGSGLVEGACKNLVGRRMKQTGACWRVERANKIAVIAAPLYSNQWKYAWIPTKF